MCVVITKEARGGGGWSTDAVELLFTVYYLHAGNTSHRCTRSCAKGLQLKN